MKRGVLLVVLVIVASICAGAALSPRITSVMFQSPYSPWVQSGDLTSSQAYPDVGARAYDDVAALTDAKTIVWDFGEVEEVLGRKRQFSFELAADGDTATITLIGFPSDRPVNTDYDPNTAVYEDGVYLGALALTAGQQVGKHSNVYAEKVTATDGAWSFSTYDNGDNNRRVIIEISSDKGYKRVFGIATSLSSARVFADHRTVQ